MTQQFTLAQNLTRPIIEAALQEDLGLGGDITSLATIGADVEGEYILVSRGKGVLSGVQIAKDAFLIADPNLDVEILLNDGARVSPGDSIATITGAVRSILMAERVALNYLGHMSGIASLTAKMQAACAPHSAKVAATRKTTPGLRIFEKHAVRCGGGLPHRMRLDDAMMIKDNHIAANGGDIVKTLEAARAYAGHTVKIEIEVDNLDQYRAVQAAGLADIIMLDNMSCADMKTAVQNNPTKAVLEASGNVTLKTIGDIAATGVDVISIGALTHSAANFDIGLDSADAVARHYREGVRTASIL